MSLQIIPIHLKNDIRPTDDLVDLLLSSSRTTFENGDILVIAQKIISKNEGRVVNLESIIPSELSVGIASAYDKDPKLVQAILSESERIVRMEHGVIIVQTKHGFVCANAGIDESNVENGYATLLPKDSDKSAQQIRLKILQMTGKKIAVVGSGPAGLACAAQLNSVGHEVTVFEKDDRIGGLLMYGIPHFKLDKEIVKRRITLMQEEGIIFITGVNIGVDKPAKELKEEYDAVVLCGGSQKPRDLLVEGRNLDGIHYAMEFLPQQNKRNEGDVIPNDIFITAKDKNVLIIGGGDTGSDCVGTSLRQGAKSLVQFELLPEPPRSRTDNNPWPQWPKVFRISSSHEEANMREGKEKITEYCVATKKFTGKNGKVTKIHGIKLAFGDPDPKTGRASMNEVPGSEFEMNVELVLLAMGFVHPIHEGMIQELDLKLDARQNVYCDENKMTSEEGVFVAGDMTRGQSLVVWAIAEGREAARSVDEFLMKTTQLPHSQFLK